MVVLPPNNNLDPKQLSPDAAIFNPPPVDYIALQVSTLGNKHTLNKEQYPITQLLDDIHLIIDNNSTLSPAACLAIVSMTRHATFENKYDETYHLCNRLLTKYSMPISINVWNRNWGRFWNGEIAKGSYGSVYPAWHDSKEVVLKEFTPDDVPTFANEYFILLHLQGRAHIIQLLGRTQTPQYALILPRAANDLRKVLKNSSKGISCEKQMKYMLEIALALHSLQTFGGIFHRDIKTENVLIDEEDNALLSDCGSGTIKNAVIPWILTTPTVLAPEGFLPKYAIYSEDVRAYLTRTQLTEVPPYGAYSDIYSLAVGVAFEIATNQVAFHAFWANKANKEKEMFETVVASGYVPFDETNFLKVHNGENQKYLKCIVDCWNHNPLKRRKLEGENGIIDTLQQSLQLPRTFMPSSPAKD